MSMGEKNPEVVGCDASIMKNVWEIRLREHGQKRQQEQERIEKSALPSINQDWANRMVAKQQGNYKRVERRAKPVDTQVDNNVFKHKQLQSPPRGLGSGRMGHTGGLSRSLSTPVPSYRNRKGQEKKINRLQLLMFITQTQPSAMVWGKSWKYNKSLPPLTEGATAASDWGQSWMFAAQQPHTEAGQPWPNGSNMMDPHSLHFWEKSAYRMIDSQGLDLSLPMEEWQMSWKKSQKQTQKGEKSSLNEGEEVSKSWMIQHHNEVLCSSGWRESWKSTKPSVQQAPSNGPNNDLINEPINNKQDNDGNVGMECWRFVNHHLGDKSKLSSLQKFHSPEWANSWRAAILVYNNHKKPDPSLGQGHNDIYDFHCQQKESNLHKVIMFVSREQKYRDLWSSQLFDELKPLSEWSKSWEITKNNSKPCDLRASPPKMEADLEAQKVGEKPNEHYSTSEKTDPCYEQQHEVIYRPKTDFTHNMLLRLKYLEKVLSVSEWKDSWKTLKHCIRLEGRRMRTHPLRPFRESEKEGEMRHTASEWKDSWKFMSQPLRQEAQLWEQDWSTMPQTRPDWARDQNNFVAIETLQNGPNGTRGWGDSWRFSRCQHHSEPGQGTAQARQVMQLRSSHHLEDSQPALRRKVMLVADWQEAWMVSETQFHYDKPSLTQWMEAWKWSAFHTEHWDEERPRHNWMDKSVKILPQREKLPLQGAKAKISQSFDYKVFRERYPEKQWNMSWRAGSLLSHQLSHHRSSGMLGKSLHSHSQQHQTTTNEYGSKWGRSFRIANPMPHMEQPWIESSPNTCHNIVMWSRGKSIRSHLYANFKQDPSALKLWGNSYRFLQGASKHKHKGKSKESDDPWVIIANKTKSRKYMYSNIGKEKPSERKWAGCHLLGKTQPRPKRGAALVKKPKMAETADKLFEEWAESWRFFVQPGSLKKHMPIKSLTGWGESWKFHLPLYQSQDEPNHKAK